ncbi:MAG: bacterial regulatory s, gntR family protein [Ramlibacter sp.]|jgi:DNA-binding GntR family transcriptional regulator|nr:bacterial regulatory s, gntR family protein [Ramlibacter sp.]
MVQPARQPASDSTRPTDATVLSILQSLQQDIVFGRLKPRERLVEEDMSARFKVGRHVIRAVLEELDRAGLVVRRPNRGAVVRDYTPAEMDQLYDVRRLLHREAAMRMELPGSPALVAELRGINDDYRRSCNDGDLYRAAGLNEQFHQTMNAACGNVFLAEMIQQFWLKTASVHSRSYATGNMQRILETIDEHDKMVEVIASGTNERLATLYIEHMRPALATYKVNHYR